MKAAVWHAAKDVRVEDIPGPGDPGPDEALVQVAYSGICGTDLHEYVDGPHFIPHSESAPATPAILGHEFSGTVLSVGANVSQAKAGDRVAVHPCQYCGQCRMCRIGMIQLCDRASWQGLGNAWGGLGEQAIVKGFQLFPLPENVTLEQGALVEPCAVTRAAVNRGGVREGDVVLVTGGGPIGQLAAMNARAAGARDVYLSEPVAGRREIAARNVNPTRAIDPSKESLIDILKDATGGDGVDVAFECSASERAFADALAATRKDGTVVQVAIFGRAISFHPATQLTLGAKRLVGTLGYGPRDYEQVIQSMAASKLPAERILTAVIDLDDVVEKGIEELMRPDTQHVKILVRTTAGMTAGAGSSS